MAWLFRTGLFTRAALGASLVLVLLMLPTASMAADEDLFCSTEAVVFGDTKVELSGPSGVRGEDADVGSNSKIGLSGSSVIEGDAVSAGEVKLSGSSAVLGTITRNAAHTDLPEVDDLVAAHATVHHNHTVGLTDEGKVARKGLELVVSGGDGLTLLGGDYYLEKLVLSGGSTLRLAGDVRVYLNGKADLSGGSLASEAGQGGSLLILGAGKSEVKLSGGSNFHGGAYLPHGKFEVSGEGDAHGAVVAREVKLSGGSEIHGHDICGQGVPELTPHTGVDDSSEPAGDDTIDHGLFLIEDPS